MIGMVDTRLDAGEGCRGVGEAAGRNLKVVGKNGIRGWTSGDVNGCAYANVHATAKQDPRTVKKRPPAATSDRGSLATARKPG